MSVTEGCFRERHRLAASLRPRGHLTTHSARERVHRSSVSSPWTSIAYVPRSSHEVAESTAATEAAMYPQRVPVNVYEASEAIVVVAPFPAVQASDVRVEVRRGDPATLRFWAHLRSAPPRDFLIHEWEYGGYERELDLPAGFGSGVEATLNNGQLAVRVLRGDATELVITPSVQR